MAKVTVQWKVEGYTFLEKSVYPGVKKLVYTPSGGGEISLHPPLGWINLHPPPGGEIGRPPSESKKSIYPGVHNLVYLPPSRRI